jgi:aryl-alcohol dehydrogenase-like predicted oxidoreductase
MEYRNLGNSGLQVSLVGLGCNNFGRRCDQDATSDIVHKAIDLGVTLFDTADVYGPRGMSEEFLGKALEGKRHDVVLATKFCSPMGEGPSMSGASRRYIMNAVEASLKRLGTDYIDLYQIHRPDPKTPIDETMRALDDLVKQGKVRYIGHSNFSGWQTAECHYISKAEHLTPFVSAQNQYNLLERAIEGELVPACKEFGVSVLPFFPLASGFLTGKYKKGEPMPEGARLTAMGPMAERMLSERNWATLGGLSEFAESHGHTMLELAMGWLASLPYVASVIAGATRPDQVEQNVKAGEWHLTAEEMAEIDTITKRR